MNILIVEDDDVLRKALAVRLARPGRAVLEAGSAGEGLEKAPEADVICLDLKLGAESGFTFLERLRGRGCYTPVIVISGAYPKAEAMEKLEKYRIVDFLEKPFKGADLVRRIDDAEEVARDMESVSKSADRIRAAAQPLRKMAEASITDIGKILTGPSGP